jgi:hypothetical protein
VRVGRCAMSIFSTFRANRYMKAHRGHVDGDSRRDIRL